MSHPKGKVTYNEHHIADRNRAKIIHALAIISASIVTVIFVFA